MTLRDKVSLEIRDGLSQRCQEFNILLDDVSITHLTFSPEFAKAIEDKQVAEQAMEKSKFLVDKAEQEQLKTIINGEADAEAAQLVSDAVKKSVNYFLLFPPSLHIYAPCSTPKPVLLQQ